MCYKNQDMIHSERVAHQRHKLILIKLLISVGSAKASCSSSRGLDSNAEAAAAAAAGSYRLPVVITRLESAEEVHPTRVRLTLILMSLSLSHFPLSSMSLSLSHFPKYLPCLYLCLFMGVFLLTTRIFCFSETRFQCEHIF